MRGLYAALFGLVSIVGYAMLTSDVSSGVDYVGCFLVAMGLYVNAGLPLAWLPTNSPRYGKRTTATGLLLSIGNCASIMSSWANFNQLEPPCNAPYVARIGLTGVLGFIRPEKGGALLRDMVSRWP